MCLLQPAGFHSVLWDTAILQIYMRLHSSWIIHVLLYLVPSRPRSPSLVPQFFIAYSLFITSTQRPSVALAYFVILLNPSLHSLHCLNKEGIIFLLLAEITEHHANYHLNQHCRNVPFLLLYSVATGLKIWEEPHSIRSELLKATWYLLYDNGQSMTYRQN